MSRRSLRGVLAVMAALAVTAGCSGDSTPDDAGEGTTTTGSAVATTAAPPTSTLPPIDGVLRLRPVLAPLPVDGIPLNPIGDDQPDDTVIAPENATGLAYELGPTAIDEDDVVGATAGIIDSQWSVTITLDPEGTTAADELAARCYARDVTCPRGQVAITVDGFVLSTPTVDQPQLGSEIVVTGSLTQAEAEALAAVLGGPA